MPPLGTLLLLSENEVEEWLFQTHCLLRLPNLKTCRGSFQRSLWRAAKCNFVPYEHFSSSSDGKKFIIMFERAMLIAYSERTKQSFEFYHLAVVYLFAPAIRRVLQPWTIWRLFWLLFFSTAITALYLQDKSC